MFKNITMKTILHCCPLNAAAAAAAAATTTTTTTTTTHIHGPFFGTTQVSWYHKGKTNPDLTEARNSEWQWH